MNTKLIEAMTHLNNIPKNVEFSAMQANEKDSVMKEIEAYLYSYDISINLSNFENELYKHIMQWDNDEEFANRLYVITYYFIDAIANKAAAYLNEGNSINDNILEIANSAPTNIKLLQALIKKDSNFIIRLNNQELRDVIIEFIKENDCNNETFKNLSNRYIGRNPERGFDGFFIKSITSIDTLTIETINIIYDLKLITDNDYELLFGKFLKDNLDYLRQYKGKLISYEIKQFLENDNYIVDDAFAQRINRDFSSYGGLKAEAIYTSIFKKLIKQNVNFIQYYLGYDPEILTIMFQRISNISEQHLINILLNSNNLSEELLMQIFNSLKVRPFDYHVLKIYDGNKFKLCKSFDKITYLLQLLGIDYEKFVHYAFNCNHNWLDTMVDIFDSNKINEFALIKDFFFEEFYKMNDKSSGVVVVKNFVELLKNYQNYPELCRNILDNQLNPEDISRIKQLFDNPSVIKDKNGNPLTRKEQLGDIENVIFKNYEEKIDLALANDDINQTKNLLCMILLNMNYKTVINNLKTYGSIKELRQLLFNNRNNNNITEDITEMMIYVSIMEDIVDCKNIEDLKTILARIKSDHNIYLMCQRCNMLFKDFSQKANELYAKEMNENLTKLDNVPEKLIDKSMSEKCGIKVIDLTDRKYCLLEHVKSQRETVDTLLEGRATGNQIFISLSLGSNRNQRLYHNGANEIIFATSFLPEELFIKSSIANMSSNALIKTNSFEVNGANATNIQRGAIETSSASLGQNSEILCYREGIKFSYIVLPGGREPTEEEIEIAKQYGLEFIKVQELNKSIENPKEIDDTIVREGNHQLGMNPSEELMQIRNVLNPKKSDDQRKIAIFTDSHALFEPTLAILEDARRSGIEEIYSLGDNIGTGPNPKEVMDLLEIYGVKSLKGNHELYVTDEIEALKEHLTRTGALEEATRNGSWTRSKLTKEQLELIKSFPEKMVITVGGKKIVLSHYMKDYNTEKEEAISEDVDRVFQGHVHFEQSANKLETIRGAGIGGKPGEASYVVLTEKPEGGYEVEVKTIAYDNKSSLQDIKESDMSEIDKTKIDNWVGGHQR